MLKSFPGCFDRPGSESLVMVVSLAASITVRYASTCLKTSAARRISSIVPIDTRA